MPQEFEAPTVQSVPTEAFAAQQKVTPDEISAALTALHEQQSEPLESDVALSIGQVLDELDLSLSAGDLWREVQAQRARAQQVPPITSVPVVENAPARPARRGKMLAGTLAVTLALLVPILRYARLSPPPPAASQPAPAQNATPPSPAAPETTSALRNERSRMDRRTDDINTDDSRNEAGTNTTQSAPTSGTQDSGGSLGSSGRQGVGTQTAQTGPASGTQTMQDPSRADTQASQKPARTRLRLPEPGNIINVDNQTRTLYVDGGIVVIGGNKDTVTAQGPLDQMIVNGNRGMVLLRGPVKQVILGGSGNTVSYPRAFPAPQVIDNGSGNVVSPKYLSPSHP